MFKKGLMMVTLMFVMMPMLAQAFFLTTKVNTTGGQLQAGTSPVQTSGSVMKSYPNGVDVPVVLTASAGYAISAVQVGATYVTPTPTANPYTYTSVAPATSQTIGVWFSKQLTSVTARAGVGGSVSPSGALNLQAGTVKTYTFTPDAGKNLVSLTGVPAGATVSSAIPAAADTAVTVSFTVPATAVTMQGAFQSLVANAGTPQTLLTGKNVTLDGTASIGAVTYAWTQTGGPTLVPSTFTDAMPVITAPAAGAYKFQLVVSDGTISSSPAIVSVTVTDSIAAAMRNQCQDCHQPIGIGATTNVFANWSSLSIHKNNPYRKVMCYDCHSGANTGGHPGTQQCSSCHGPAQYGGITVSAANYGVRCTPCHGDIHALAAPPAQTSCIQCHAVNQNAGAGFVQDNNGVRSITNEFAKWSHHVTGVNLQDAHCAACHLAGKVSSDGTKIMVDHTYHAADAKIHLRNADTDGDFQWDPAAPSHTTMDNFCMSCHDADGANSDQSAAIRTIMIPAAGATASNINPFADTISNQYDKMLRGRVVDASGQFNTANASHHAVKGKKYSGRTEEAGARQIANPTAFDANENANTYVFDNTSTTLAPARWTLPDAGLVMETPRKTLYEAGRFVSTYVTLADAAGEPVGRNGGQSLGDDSTLHCGDCHTVGQYKPGSSVNSDGSATTVVIGAHGSENEYLLRNSIGTDALHRGAQYNYAPANMSKVTGIPSSASNFAGNQFYEWLDPAHPVNGTVSATLGTVDQLAIAADENPTQKPFLVCYNCHVYTEYGSVYFSNTAGGGREGSHAYGDHTRGNYCNGPYNTSGSGRATTWTAVAGQQVTGVTGTFMGISNFNYGRLQPGTATTALDGTATGPTSATLLAAGMNGSGVGAANIFQIQCINCHNAGSTQGFGGIHGSKINTYTDGNGNVQKPRRFLPGLNNVGFVPGDSKIKAVETGEYLTEDQKWEQVAGISNGQAGCYTLNTATTSSAKNKPIPTNPEAGGTLNAGSGQFFGTWGACTDHAGGAGTKTNRTGDALERTIVRPVEY